MLRREKGDHYIYTLFMIHREERLVEKLYEIGTNLASLPFYLLEDSSYWTKQMSCRERMQNYCTCDIAIFFKIMKEKEGSANEKVV